MTSVFANYKIDFSGNRLNNATKLIETIKPHALKEYLDNYYLVKRDSKNETLDDFNKHEEIKNI